MLVENDLLLEPVNLSTCYRTVTSNVTGTKFLCHLLRGFQKEVWETVIFEDPNKQILTIEDLIKLRLSAISDRPYNWHSVNMVADEIRFRVASSVIDSKEPCIVQYFYHILSEVFHDHRKQILN